MSLMRRKSNLSSGLIVVIAMSSWVVGCGSLRSGSPSALEPLPMPARLSVEREVGDGSVKKVSADEFEGRAVYHVAFLTADKQKGDLQVTSDGRVLRKEIALSEVNIATLPEAVRAAAVSQTGGVLPRTATRGMIGAREVYAIEVQIAGRDHGFVFDSGGKLLESSEVIDAGQLPMTAKAALLQRFPGHTVGEVEEVRAGTQRYFEVELKHEGRWVEVTILDDGTFRSVAAK